jgi:putative Ca2+/H+ antiporter (TMEM165/GDT1 family)
MYVSFICFLFFAFAIGSNGVHFGQAHETETDSSFVSAFVSSISMIFVSEIGDKTFFIAGMA